MVTPPRPRGRAEKAPERSRGFEEEEAALAWDGTRTLAVEPPTELLLLLASRAPSDLLSAAGASAAALPAAPPPPSALVELLLPLPPPCFLGSVGGFGRGASKLTVERLRASSLPSFSVSTLSSRSCEAAEGGEGLGKCRERVIRAGSASCGARAGPRDVPRWADETNAAQA